MFVCWVATLSLVRVSRLKFRSTRTRVRSVHDKLSSLSSGVPSLLDRVTTGRALDDLWLSCDGSVCVALYLVRVTWSTWVGVAGILAVLTVLPPSGWRESQLTLVLARAVPVDQSVTFG